MPFTDDTIITNSWCSLYDCKRYVWDIDEHLSGNITLLETAIETATASAKGILRRKFGDDMPFSESDPPRDIRHKISICASYNAIRSRAYSVGSHEGLLEALKSDCEDSQKYFNDIADGRINFSFTSTDVQKPTYTPKPNGMFGFDRK